MKKPLVGLVFGIILTAVFLWPILANFSTHLSSRQDGILVAWLIDWGSRSLLSGQNFFNAPFFYPNENTIAYSDLFFSTGLFNIPLKLLGSSNLITNHNFHLVAGSVVIFIGQYFLAQQLFKKTNLSLLSASIFAFSHLRLDYMAHLHVFLVAGLPWGIYFLLKFQDEQKQKYLLGLTLAGLYQFLNSPMSGYFLVTILLCFIGGSQNLQTTLKKNWRLLLPWIIGSVLILIFFYQPYWQLSNTYNFTRTIRDAAHFAFGLEKFLEPEVLLWAGLLGLLIGTNLKKGKTINKTYFVITLVGGIFMLGPALKYQNETIKIFDLPIPLPYAIAYYLIPGLNAFRATSRFVIVFLFGLSLLIPQLISTHKLLDKNVDNQKIINILIASLILSMWILRLPKQKIFAIPTTVPPIYFSVANQPQMVLAEFPTYVWSQTDQYFHEADRLLFQSTHQKKLYNGFSGFAPPELENRWHTISDRLNENETIKHLRDSGVELVLLHQEEKPEYKNFTSNNYQLITCADSDCLYLLK